jgi:hypothetical protein
VLEYMERCCLDMLSRTIVTTALPEKYREHLGDYDIGGVLPKPVDFEVMRHMLATALQRD